MTSNDDLAAETARELAAFLDEWLVREDVPGASLAVVDREGIQHATGVGARDMESNAPATGETLYGIGSATKPVTAMAVLQLVGRGDLSLSEPVNDHVPHLRDAPGEPVTVGELLTHTSGIPEDGIAQAMTPRLLGDGTAGAPTSSPDDVRRYVEGGADWRLTDRDRYMYSNSGYLVLGALVEAVDGRPYAEYVSKAVLDPLGMDRTGFGRSALDGDEGATTYLRDGDELVARDLPTDRLMYPSGGLVAPVTDLAALVLCVLNGGEHEGTRVLGEDLVARACAFQAPRQPTTDGHDRGYGYGWYLREFLGERLVDHGGSIAVSSAYVGLLPESGVGVALAFNTAGLPKSEIGRGLLAILQGADPERAVRYLATWAKCEAVAGTYEGYRGLWSATVEARGTRIEVRLARSGRETAIPAFPETPGRDDYAFFTVTGGGHRMPVEFRETESGMDLLFDDFRLRRNRMDSRPVR